MPDRAGEPSCRAFPIGMQALVAGLVPVLLPMLAEAAVQIAIKDMVMTRVGRLLTSHPQACGMKQQGD